MKINKKIPLVVIFGRTNVGKSTLFNCLTEKNKALVADIEGTTRDSNIGEVSWNGKTIELIDTGGIIDLKYLRGEKTKTEDIESKVQKQARKYLTKADLILFLVDTRAGLLPTDKQMALELKKIIPNTKKIILVANKADSPRLRKETAEFNKLSLNEPIAISSTSGSGTGDLLDEVINKLKILKPSKLKTKVTVVVEKEESPINICIVGKPNVGKSSLLNSLLGEDRAIVSEVPHTTREPQDTKILYKNKLINLIDTAGISKRGQKGARAGKKKNTLEKFSISKSLSSLNRADIALLVVDIEEGLTHQDSKMVEEIVARRVSLIIVANKWDSVEEKDTKHFTQEIQGHFPFAAWAPIQFTSALTGEKIKKILPLILEIDEQRKALIPENALSKFLQRIVKRHAPAKAKGTKHPYIYTLKQVLSNPPKFIIRIGAKDTIHFSYVRFIENRLREKFGFKGTPLNIAVENNKLIHGKHKEKTIKTSEDKKESNKIKNIKPVREIKSKRK